MRDFTVTFERVNEREAMNGGTSRHGVSDSGLSLREALQDVRNSTPSASETRGTYANNSRHNAARYFSLELEDWETGDNVTLAIHFPANATPASRARLCRLLDRVM